MTYQNVADKSGLFHWSKEEVETLRDQVENDDLGEEDALWPC